MKKLLVVIDPGHYGKNYNKGIIKGYYESDRMYQLSLLEKKALKKYGIDVIITRDDKSNPTLTNRGLMAVNNAKNYEKVVFISNHSNAVETSSKTAYGVLGYRSAFLPKSADLGNKILDSIVDVMKAKTKVTYKRGLFYNLGVSGYDYLGVIRGATNYSNNIVAADKNPVHYVYLIEHGFHTNDKECSFLMDDKNLKKIAKAVSKTIADYFNITL